MLGIIVGAGHFPKLFIDALKRQAKQDYFILGIRDHWNAQDYAGENSAEIALGQFEQGFKILKANHCQKITFIGKIQRTAFHWAQKDSTTSQLFDAVLNKGDDYALKKLAEIATQYGFEIIPPEHYFPELMCTKQGALGKIQPTEAQMNDIIRGQEVLNIISQADIGQSVIIQNGLILCVEAIEGTNAMIARGGALQMNPNPNHQITNGVMVKLPKLQQSRAMDLPAIGMETVENISAAKLAGIAIQQYGIIFLEQEKVIDYADAHGIFIYALPAAGDQPRPTKIS